jgi:hypothetical protein
MARPKAGLTYTCIVGGVLLITVAPGRIKLFRKHLVTDLKQGTFGMRSIYRAARNAKRGVVDAETITPMLPGISNRPE